MSWLSDWLGPPTIKVPKPKKVEPPAPRKKILRYDNQEFEVGATTVLIIFEDGREVHSKIYGTVDQYVRTPFQHGDDYRAYPPSIQTSEDTYKNWMQNVSPNEPIKVFDDGLNPSVTWIGKIAHMEIHETVKHTVTHTVATVIDEPMKEEGAT